MTRSAGRMKIAPQTIEETGFPGNPIIGIPSSRPAMSGFPGRMATLWNARSMPRVAATLPTRS